MSRSRPSGFASVVLDVDSTLCNLEGIDWLAARRGESIAREVAVQTDRAMRGEIPLEEVYGNRLALVRPQRDNVDALAHAYIQALAPGAIEAVSAWRQAGVHVVLVSSAIRQSVLRLAEALGLSATDVHAVDLHFDAIGAYDSYDRDSPLATSGGKREIVRGLDLPRPILAVGDGSTDLAIRGEAEGFAAFTGFVRREAVAQDADFVVTSFDELTTIVLGGS